MSLLDTIAILATFFIGAKLLVAYQAYLTAKQYAQLAKSVAIAVQKFIDENN